MTPEELAAIPLTEKVRGQTGSINEAVWWQVIQPAYPSTGGLAQTMYCLVCGAAVVITENDSRAASLHIDWHIRIAEQGAES